jgi:hypothetical protein
METSMLSQATVEGGESNNCLSEVEMNQIKKIPMFTKVQFEQKSFVVPLQERKCFACEKPNVEAYVAKWLSFMYHDCETPMFYSCRDSNCMRLARIKEQMDSVCDKSFSIKRHTWIGTFSLVIVCVRVCVCVCV